MRAVAFLFVLFLSACAMPKTDTPDVLGLSPASYDALPGWQNDNHAVALAAFLKSCGRIEKKNAAEKFGPDGVGGSFGAWQGACAAAKNLPPEDNAAARAFFEQWFSPWQAYSKKKWGPFAKDGLFTGYYEAELEGSLTRQGPYQTPLYLKPGDLVMVDLGKFRDELKGQRIAGRVVDGNLQPYEDRAAIENGALAQKDLELVWVSDPVDAFFLQIQGSGRIRLEDGSVMRVGYAGQNGYPYFAIGRELVKRGALKKEDVSLQSIRQWMEGHPQEAVALMQMNKSYVFFRKLDGEGPLGGEGLALSPGRSLAIDRSLLPYGVPIWLDAQNPAQDGRIQRLMVAQDTGGAIRGAVRGDVFWGFGDQAEHMAGLMKSKGRYWLLLPKAQ